MLQELRQALQGFPAPRVRQITTTAKMLAAYRLLPRDEQEVFLGEDAELTASGWDAVQDHADRLYRDREGADRQGVSPFDHRERAEDTPGYYEAVRRVLVPFLRGDSGAAELDLSELCLRLLGALDSSWGEQCVDERATTLVCEVLRDAGGRTAYFGFGGAAGIALRLCLGSYSGDLEVPAASSASFYAALAVAASANLAVFTANPFITLRGQWPDSVRRYDVAAVVPPINAKVDLSHPLGTGLPPPNSESWGVFTAAVRAELKAACVVSNGFLFRTTLTEQSFKERALRHFGLSAIVSLPLGIFPTTGVAGSVVFLDREQRPEGVFVADWSNNIADGDTAMPSLIEAVRQRDDTQWSALLSWGEFATQDFNLLPERWILSDHESGLVRLLHSQEHAPLDQIVDIYRPQATPGSPSNDADDDDPMQVRELSVSDLDEWGLARSASKEIRLSAVDLRRIRKAELAEGDVLLVTKGSAGRVGFVRTIPPAEIWVANQSFAVLRLRRNAPIRDARVLFRYLSSEMGQTLIRRLRVGATIQSIQMGDVRSISVLVPPLDEQARLIHEVDDLFGLISQIDTLKAQVASRRRELWPDSETI